MAAIGKTAPAFARERNLSQYLPDLQLGLQNLMQHKLRSLLTMLGMIFGVAAVSRCCQSAPARSNR